MSALPKPIRFKDSRHPGTRLDEINDVALVQWRRDMEAFRDWLREHGPVRPDDSQGDAVIKALGIVLADEIDAALKEEAT